MLPFFPSRYLQIFFFKRLFYSFLFICLLKCIIIDFLILCIHLLSFYTFDFGKFESLDLMKQQIFLFLAQSSGCGRQTKLFSRALPSAKSVIEFQRFLVHQLTTLLLFFIYNIVLISI